MPDLWLRKVFPAVVNVNSEIPEKTVKMILTNFHYCQKTVQISRKRNMVSRYVIRPSEEVFNQPRYVSFVKNYQLLPKQVENDSQPNELSNEVNKENHSVNNNNSDPKRITFSTGEKEGIAELNLF